MSLTFDRTLSIYIAGKYDARNRLRPYRDMMRTLGWDVTSNWMDEKNAASTPASRIEEASRDMMEVSTGGTFILDTIDESNTGGREVELGIALACGHQIVMIGPIRNVFHDLIPDRYEDWASFLHDLQAN